MVRGLFFCHCAYRCIRCVGSIRLVEYSYKNTSVKPRCALLVLLGLVKRAIELVVLGMFLCGWLRNCLTTKILIVSRLDFSSRYTALYHHLFIHKSELKVHNVAQLL